MPLKQETAPVQEQEKQKLEEQVRQATRNIIAKTKVAEDITAAFKSLQELKEHTKSIAAFLAFATYNEIKKIPESQKSEEIPFPDTGKFIKAATMEDAVKIYNEWLLGYWEIGKKGLDLNEDIIPNFHRNAELAKKLWKEWFTPEYMLGSPLQKIEPIGLTLPQEHIDEMTAKWKSKLGSSEDVRGVYVPWWNRPTNIITLAPNPKAGEKELDPERVIAHELMHFATVAGRGKLSPWFHEGATEVLTQQLFMAHGKIPQEVGRHESGTKAALCIESVAGEAAFKRACLTGNFGEVEKAVDKSLGKGTFGKFSAFEDGAEAHKFITEKMKEAGIKEPEWFR